MQCFAIFNVAKVAYFRHTSKEFYSTNFIFCYIYLEICGKSNIFAWFL